MNKSFAAILRECWNKILKQNLFLVSAGVTFYWLLGFVPGISAIISLYGLLADSDDVDGLFQQISLLFPGDTLDFLRRQVKGIAKETVTAGVGAFGSLTFALWTNFNAVKNVMKACNIIYLVPKDERNFWEFHLAALAFTLFATVVSLIMIFILSTGPVFIDRLDTGPGMTKALIFARWPIMAVLGLASLAFFYQYGPYRKGDWRWASWGAVVATSVWLGASYLFSLYVDSFQSYNRMYGSFGWIIAVMLWFWISVGSVLFGALINRELEEPSAGDHPSPSAAR